MPHLTFQFEGGEVARQMAIEVRKPDLLLLRRVVSSDPVEVEPGQYLFIAKLPGGRSVDKQVEVGKTPHQTVVFDLAGMERVTAQAGFGTLFYSALRAPLGDALSVVGSRPTRAFNALGHASIFILTFDADQKEWHRHEEWPISKPLPSHLEVAFKPRQLKFARIEQKDKAPFFVALPGAFLRPATIEFGRSERGELLAVPHPSNRWADMLLQFLSCSELAEASTLADPMIGPAAELVAGKKEDPIAAIIGAYALLRSGHLEHLHQWTQLLVKYRSWLPDTHAIYAEYLARMDKGEDADRELLELPDDWTPLFADGLRYAIERFPPQPDPDSRAARLYRRLCLLAAVSDPKHPALSLRNGPDSRPTEMLIVTKPPSPAAKEQLVAQHPKTATPTTLKSILDDFPPVIGKWPIQDAIKKLRDLGADDKASDLELKTAQAAAQPQGGHLDWLTGLWRTHPYQHTEHSVGFLAADPATTAGPIDIKEASMMAADQTLRDQRITVSLAMLRTWNYPGSGTHNVLLNFGARNQAPDGAEPLAFNLTARSRDGESAGVLNYPIFVGLKVGGEGIAFEGSTVNVNSEGDKSILDVLESDLFRDGLTLLETAQPVIKPFTGLGLGVAKAMAKRSENVPVHAFRVGMSFDANPGSIRLCIGLYLIAQVPPGLDWSEWVYLPAKRTIVKRDDNTVTLPVNFVAVGVRRSAPPSQAAP